MLTCPVCQATDVHPSHRRGILERGPLTWCGIFPFRCGQCGARFYRSDPRDPRRRGSGDDPVSRADLPRPPRWIANVPAVVTVSSPGRESLVLQGVAVNVSLEGARLRLPTALPEGSLVKVALGAGDSRLGTVCWALAQGESEVLHGMRFQVPLERGEVHTRPLRRLQRRQLLRRCLIVLITLAAIAIAAYGLNWWIDQFRIYYPKHYEPKDIERQEYEQQQLKELRG